MEWIACLCRPSNRSRMDDGGINSVLQQIVVYAALTQANAVTRCLIACVARVGGEKGVPREPHIWRWHQQTDDILSFRR
jgi:hypothetical protein